LNEKMLLHPQMSLLDYSTRLVILTTTSLLWDFGTTEFLQTDAPELTFIARETVAFLKDDF